MAVRVVRVAAISAQRAFIARAISFVLALIVTAIVLAAAGFEPLSLGSEIIRKSFGSAFGIQDLGLLFAPLILTGLAVTVTLRIGLWNIGADGQFYIGAFLTTAIGIHVTGVPLAPMLLVLFVAGALGGMAWILVPALARAYGRVDEIITTLLLNFVALLLVYYVSTGPWRDRVTGVTAATGRVEYDVPELYGALHWGFVVALIAPILVSLLIRYTKWGYEVRVSGANPEAAHFAGMAVKRRMVSVMLLSGAIAGIAGMLEIAGSVHRLQGGISNNFGYLGIMVAVLARGRPLAVLPAAFLIAVLLNAGIILQTKGLTTSAVLAVTGLMMLFIAIGDQLAHYRPVRGAAAGV
jgi:general nucleoside transport system permease protein